MRSMPQAPLGACGTEGGVGTARVQGENHSGGSTGESKAVD